MSIQLIQETVAKAGYPKIELITTNRGKNNEKNTLEVLIPKAGFQPARKAIVKKLFPILKQKLGSKCTVINRETKIEFNDAKPETNKLNNAFVLVKQDVQKSVSDNDQESLHAYYFYQEIEGKDIVDSKGKPREIPNVEALPIKSIFDKCDATWHESGKFAAKTFQKKFKLGKGYSYLQRKGSTWVDNLYKVAVRLYKEAKVPFSDSNKWNPADMWICKNQSQSRKAIDDCGSITQLNAYLRKEFKKKNIIGISLKKMSGMGVNEISNMDTDDLREVEYTGFDFGKQKGPYTTGGSIYFKVNGKEKKMGLRAFNISKKDDISADVAGLGALGGKVGYTEINRIFKKFGLQLVNKNTDIASRKMEESFQFLYEQIKKSNTNLPTTVKNGQDFKNALATTGGVNVNSPDFIGWIISKVQTVETVMSIESSRDKEKILLGMFAYATSTTEDSGPFVLVKM